jgi:hypothetical protein
VNHFFIIPLSAPIPTDLESVPLEQGTFLHRLSALDAELPDSVAHLVPLSGDELLALVQAWRSLVNAKKVAVLTELPGATYDILFTQATRQIGLKHIDWPTIETALLDSVISAQRTKDTQPWKDPQSAKFEETRLDADPIAKPIPSSDSEEEETTTGFVI